MGNIFPMQFQFVLTHNMHCANQVRISHLLTSGNFYPQPVSNEIYWASMASHESFRYASGLSLKFVSKGKEEYLINQVPKTLHSQTFLVLNKGDQVELLADNHSSECLTVTIEPALLMEVYHSLNQQIDESSDSSALQFTFFDEAIRESDHFMKFLNTLTDAVKNGQLREPSPEFYYTFATRLLEASKCINEKMALISSLKPATRKEVYKRLNRGKCFIEDNCTLKLDLGTIARNSMLSKFHFLRAFKQVYGLTPHHYHNSLRIGKAKELLINGEKIKEIYLHLSYPDVFTFTKQFKQFTGYSPAVFRNIMAPSQKIMSEQKETFSLTEQNRLQGIFFKEKKGNSNQRHR